MLFGGANSHLALPIREADVLSTVQSAPAWSSLGSPEPVGLYSPQLVFDPEHGREILVGARYDGEMRVWSLDAKRDPGWTEIAAEPQPSPAQSLARAYSGLIADTAHERVVMFGGLLAAPSGVSCPEGCPPSLGDVWGFGLED